MEQSFSMYKFIFKLCGIICLLFVLIIHNNFNSTYARTRQKAINIKVSKYDSYPKTVFAYKTYILKNSTYSDDIHSYKNEYFLKNESPSNWTEKLVIQNFIQIKNPIEYAEEKIKQNNGKIIYTRKFHYAIYSNMPVRKTNGKQTLVQILTKAEMNPKAPGIQVFEYYKKYPYTTKRDIKLANDSSKLVYEKYIHQILQYKIPQITNKRISIN